MPFIKGVSGNPNGRPQNPESELLRKAIETVSKKRKINIYELFVERAIEDNQVLIALMKKILPDKKAEDIKHSGKIINIIRPDPAKRPKEEDTGNVSTNSNAGGTT